MALFVVNRYLGEDNEVNKSSNNEDGLDKLLEKIEQRRKLKLKEFGDFNHLHPDSDSSDKSLNEDLLTVESDLKLGKKKGNRKSLEVENHLKNGEVETEDLTIKKKRKRQLSLSDLEKIAVKEVEECKNIKKFKNSIEDYSDLNGVGNESLKSTVKSKKEKKKRKLSETDVANADEHGEDLNERTESKKRTKRKKISSEKEIGGDGGSLNDSTGVDDACNEKLGSTDVAENILLDENLESKVSEFTVIGGHNFKGKKSIKWILPEWLSKPVIISGSLKDRSAAIEDIKGVDERIISNLKKNNIEHFFPVQQQVIPWVLSESHCSGPGLRFWPRDICVSAPTGSGKTLSFVLPIIQRLKKRLVRRIGALVVVPVQDLAAQVAQVFGQYTFGTGLQVLSVTGKKMPLLQEQKLLVYRKAGVGYESLVDIMVTTPGRLVEHIKETPGFSLHHLKFLVIDEADRVIDNIKNDWLYHLENHISSGGIGAVPPLSLNTLKQLPLRPQKLLFSATLTQDPEKLKQINLFQPRLFVYKATGSNNCNENGLIEPTKTGDDILSDQIIKPVELKEQWIECSTQLKPLILYHILAEKNWRGVLCFTHFTDATHRLTRLLHHLSYRHGLNLTIEEISSERSFNDRHRILNDFRAGKIDVLVCTDVYARGMDILEVRYVVLYSPPVHTRNYIHQVGRTARAGMKGTALTLLTPPQVKSFHKMLKGTGRSKLKEIKVTEEDLSYLGGPYQKALRSLKKETMKEKESSKQQAKITKRKNFVQHKRTMKKKVNNVKNKNRDQNGKEIKCKRKQIRTEKSKR